MLIKKFVQLFNKTVINKKFSVNELNLPIIDLKKFIREEEGWNSDCKLVGECLHDTGILIVRDPVYS